MIRSNIDVYVVEVKIKRDESYIIFLFVWVQVPEK